MQIKSKKKIKIVSWNVNGLRAVLSKGAINEVFNLSPRVLCLQEIKMKKEQLPDDRIEKFAHYNQKRAFPRSLLRNNGVRLWNEQAGEKEPQCIGFDIPLRVSCQV